MPKKELEQETVKTTINLPKTLWRDFSVKVITDKGGRKNNEVIKELIKKYLEEN